MDGDEVVFGVAGGGDSLDDLTLSLTAFRFAALILPEHNFHLTAGASLTLNGFGIDNVSRVPGVGQPQNPPGVVRQQFYMDGGSTMTFRNNATIGGSDAVFNLPVDLSALGGTTVGGSGGRIIFENNSTASGPPANTSTGLRIFGAAVAGAGGGELRFSDDASMGATARFETLAGDVAGAQGGLAVFGDRSTASGNVSNETGDGQGGRIIFQNSAVADDHILLNNYGGTHLELGAEAETQFLDDSALSGFVQNFAGQVAGAAGGRLEFRNRARFDGTPIPPGSGSILIFNKGAGTADAESGRTVFYDESQIVGANTLIRNEAEIEGSNPGTVGGMTEFLGQSRAGQSTIDNSGATSGAPGTEGGRTFFRENSSAENAVITASGGRQEGGAIGGSVSFSGASTAANAALTAASGTDGGLGGKILFAEMASGGAASVTVELGGEFDISALATAGTTLGSIAGAGTFFLGSKSLTVGSDNANTVVSGVISDGGQAGGAGATLTKVGPGTLELGGANAFTGPTHVNGGALLVTGALGNAPVDIASGATLGGTGTIGGPVIVANGGIISPGKGGPGTLTVGALTLNANSILDYQLGTMSDRIDVNGPLTLDGAINIGTVSGGLTVGVYRLLNYTGAFTDNGLALGTLPTGTSASDFSIETNVTGQVNVVLNGGGGDLLFWDGPNLTANGVVNGGTGTWLNPPSNWTNSGGTVQQAWASKTAVFSGTAGTVTLGENVTARGLQFVTNGYVVNAGVGQSITLDGTAPIRVDAGASATINAMLTGGALDKIGIGSLTLSANNSYSGGTTVSDGLLIVTNSAGLGLGTGAVTVLPTFDVDLRFTGSASAGSIAITARGNTPSDTGISTVRFFNSATAGTASISNLANAAARGFGASISFDDTSQAGSAVIDNFGTAFENPTVLGVEYRGAGNTFFLDRASAASATITNMAGQDDRLFGGRVEFFDTSTAGTASVINRGGTTAGALGGLTLFTGSSTAASATLTVEGGANGGLGGTIRFTQLATGGTPRVIFIPGDAADGLLDISATSFTTIGIGSIEGNGRISLGSKRIEVGGSNLDTEFSGAIDGSGGSLRKVGTAMLTLAGDSTFTGGTIVSDGVLRVTNTNGLGLGSGPVTVFPTFDVDLRFTGSASAGSIAITARGNTPMDTGISTVSFFDSATAGTASISNLGNAAARGFGALTSFDGTSQAGSAVIDNFGTAFANPTGLGVEFRGAGNTFFLDRASAASATITNLAGLDDQLFGGRVEFFGNSTAGTSTVLNRGGTNTGARGGLTLFTGSSTGGSATLRNKSGAFSGAGVGQTIFYDLSDAEASTLDNEGGRFAAQAGGLTEFRGTSHGGTGVSTNQPGAIANAYGGRTDFYDTAKAGTRRFINIGGAAANGYAGGMFFRDNSDAENATFTNQGSTVAAANEGGVLFFQANSKAGAATISNDGSPVSNVTAITLGGRTEFSGAASAEHAVITNHPGVQPNGNGGVTTFITSTATAGQATIYNEGSTLNAFGGSTYFFNGATAGQATIVNRGGSPGGSSGGYTAFSQNSTAAGATITAEGSDGFASGTVSFTDTSSAGSAALHANGATSTGGSGGTIYFNASSTAGNAILFIDAGVATGGGGSVIFSGTSGGGSARVIMRSSGLSISGLDLSQLTNAGTTIGSIEGTGIVSLGSKRLTVGGNNVITTFSGILRDGGFVNQTGGALSITGAGTLILSGANTYSGGTTIGNGVTANSGKLIAGNISGSATGTGPVTIRRGGTLSGSGFIAGPVTLQVGGAIVPGDPVTLTLQDSLTWDGGSIIRLALGPDQAGSDRLDIGSAFIRGDDAGGAFTFEVQDFGAVVGNTYDFIHFGSLQGFTPQDFTFSGMEGNVAIVNNSLAFTVTQVPELGAIPFALAGGAILLAGRRRGSGQIA